MACAPTKAELLERAERAERTAWLLGIALNCALSKPDAVQHWSDENDAGTYKARLYHAAAPHGGIVLVTFSYPDQSDHTSADYFEDWHREVRRVALSLGQHGVHDAAERLMVARYEILRRKSA